MKRRVRVSIKPVGYKVFETIADAAEATGKTRAFVKMRVTREVLGKNTDMFQYEYEDKQAGRSL